MQKAVLEIKLFARRNPKFTFAIALIFLCYALIQYSVFSQERYLKSPRGIAETKRTEERATAEQMAVEEKNSQELKISMAKTVVGVMLRDPSSAEWLGVKVVKTDGKDVVCGMVNANNAFGGKAGYESFADVYEKPDDAMGKLYMTSRGSQQAKAVDHFCP